MNERELNFIIRFRNEAAAALRAFQGQLRRLGPALRRLQQGFQKVAQAVDRFGQRLRRAGEAMRTAGSQLSLLFTGPIAAAIGGSVAAAASFEQALAGVQKTVDASAPVIERLGVEFQRLSDRIPVSANELAGIGEIAGQLGIQTGAILDFTETVAQLGVATNLSTEEAATGLARFANITGTAQQDIDRLGSSLVELGNNFAANEREILDFGLRLAGVGKTVGLTEGDIFGLGTALASVGIRAEAGGTAISNTLIEIANSVKGQTEELKVFAQVAGLSVDEFSRLFERDAVGALQQFAQGLDRVNAAGGNVFEILDNVGLEGARTTRAILGLSRASGVLEKAIEAGNRGFEENVALSREAEIFFGTLANRFRTLRNQVFNTAVAFGEALRPAIERLFSVASRLFGPDGALRRAAEALRNASERTKLLVAGIAALVAGLGPLLLIVGSVVTLFGFFASGVAALSAAFGAISFGAIASAIGGLLAPILAIVAALGAVTAAILTASGETVTFGTVAKEVVNGVIRFFQLLVEATKVVAGTIKDVLVDAFSNVGQVVGGVAASVSLLVQGEFREAGAALVGIFDDASAEVATKTPERFKDFFTNVQDILAAESDPLGDAVAAVGGKLGDVTGANFLENFKRNLAELPGVVAEASRTQTGGDGGPTPPTEPTGFLEGIRQGFQEFRTEALDSTAQGKAAFLSFTESAGDALDEFAETGKLNWQRFASDALAAIRRIVLNRLFVQLFETLGSGGGGEGGGGGGIFGSILGGLGTAFGGGSTAAATANRGGVIGDPSMPRALVPRGLFRNARRFQAGGAVDSVPALLTPGERVLSVEQNRAFERGMMGGRPIQVTINVQTPDVEGFRRSENQIAAELSAKLQRATTRDT